MNAAVIKHLANTTATFALPADVAGVTCDGIFDAAYQVVDPGTGAISSTTPAFTVSVVDLPDAVVDALEAGDDVVLEMRGETYTVVEPQPDGTGFTVLRLRK